MEQNGKASTDEINALPKGVYIVNGKKIIIKNQQQ